MDILGGCSFQWFLGVFATASTARRLSKGTMMAHTSIPFVSRKPIPVPPGKPPLRLPANRYVFTAVAGRATSVLADMSRWVEVRSAEEADSSELRVL